MNTTETQGAYAQHIGDELLRRRLGLGWKLLHLIVGGVGAVLGIPIAKAFVNPWGTTGPMEIIVGLAIMGLSITMIVRAFTHRPTAIFGARGLIVEKRSRPPIVIPYDQVESIAAYRIRMRHNGAYMGTSMHLDLKFVPGAALQRLSTHSSHREQQVGRSGFSLTHKYETVPQPEDTVAELVTTYIAPRLMERIERGETVTIGSRVSLDRAGLHLRFVLSRRSIPWTQCIGLELGPYAWQLRLVDGSVVGIPGGVQAMNLPSLALMAPVLCTGGHQA